MEEAASQIDDPNVVDRQRYELLWVFAFLSLAHIAVFYFAIPTSDLNQIAFPVWIAYGGIGTIAVWFAWTCRPLFARIARAGIICCLFYVSVSNVIPHHMYRSILSNRASIERQWRRNKQRMIKAKQSPEAIRQAYDFIKSAYRYNSRDTLYEILLCWVCGALLVAYFATWFTGYRLIPPGESLSKTPLSIQSILVLTFVAALAFYFIRAQNPSSRTLYFVNGMTVGVLACTTVWAIFQKQLWKKAVVPVLAVATVIALDLVFGRMLSAWKGDLLDRANYVVRFACGLVVSPLATAIVLQRAGYRLAR